MDYRDIDWFAVRPDPVELAQDWDRTTITVVPELDPRLCIVRDILNATHVNGGAQLAQFTIASAPAVRWVLSRNRLDEFGLLERLFEHSVVRTVLPAVAEFRQPIDGFHMESTFTAFGRLASWIKCGGAYSKFEGSDADALKLATDFMDAAFALQFSEVVTWVNWKPWTNWFFEVAWDGTFIWFDPRRGVLTILLITDTD